MARLQDESLSIGTSLLAVGSACAIASLWPVHDAATAVLMIRVYEEMIRNPLDPPQALRRAALWLETASGDEVSKFLTQHPRLKDEFARRSDLSEVTTRGPNSVAAAAPFAHPIYWAAFIASGA
jgi:CHAT domain-containing protein